MLSRKPLFVSLISIVSLVALGTASSAQGSTDAPPIQPPSQSSHPGVDLSLHPADVKSVGMSALRTQKPATQSCVDTSDEKGDLTLCVTDRGAARRVGSAPDPAQVEANVSDLSDIEHLPLPDDCISIPSKQWQGNRIYGCWRNTSDLTITRRINNVPTVVGSIVYAYYTYVYTAQDSLTYANQLLVMPLTVTGEGVGWTVDAEPYLNCGNTCTVTDWQFDSALATRNSMAVGTAYSRVDNIYYGFQNQNRTDWRFWFERTGKQSTGATVQGADMRCDNKMPNQAAGCILQNFHGSMVYSIGDLPDFSSHVMRAQASGLPGGRASGEPLTRETDKTRIDMARSQACPDRLVRPPGKSCDEYPFASTWQGAAYASESSARTFEGCSIELTYPPSTGRTGYSRCMIDDEENTRAGRLLDQLALRPHRVLQLDGYWVDFK